jgi:cell division protein ZapA
MPFLEKCRRVLMENNKVKVKIYGQEYIISGDKSREEIIQVAAHVDMKMHEVAEAAKASSVTASNIAVLSAVNITSEYFQVLEEMEEYKRMNIQLEKDAQHYVQLWDESKKNYMDYKEETQAIVLQKDQLVNQLKAKEAENQQLRESVENAQTQAQSSMESVVKDVEDKCRELENSFFDLQMENLQLKKEIEKYKNNSGQV